MNFEAVVCLEMPGSVRPPRFHPFAGLLFCNELTFDTFRILSVFSKWIFSGEPNVAASVY